MLQEVNKMKSIKTYSELCELSSFEDRYNYLKLEGSVGFDTFGFDRWMNQMFYKSKEWKDIRNYIITRDNGCDMGLKGYEINDKIIIHHMNPITVNDIIYSNAVLLDPEQLICVSQKVHNAIHYGSDDLLIRPIVERMPNDTVPWRK